MEKNALSKNYVVYRHTSRPVDEYFVAYIKESANLTMPSINELINMFVSQDGRMLKFLDDLERKIY